MKKIEKNKMLFFTILITIAVILISGNNHDTDIIEIDKLNKEHIEFIQSKLDHYICVFEDDKKEYKIVLENLSIKEDEKDKNYIEIIGKVSFEDVQTKEKSQIYEEKIKMPLETVRNLKNINNSKDTNEVFIILELNKRVPRLFSKYIYTIKSTEKNSFEEISDIRFSRNSGDGCYKSDWLSIDSFDFYEKIVQNGTKAVKYSVNYSLSGEEKIYRVKDVNFYENLYPLWYVNKEAVESIVVYRDKEMFKIVEEKAKIRDFFNIMKEYKFEKILGSVEDLENFEYRIEFKDDKHEYVICIGEDEVIIVHENRKSQKGISKELEFFINIF